MRRFLRRYFPVFSWSLGQLVEPSRSDNDGPGCWLVIALIGLFTGSLVVPALWAAICASLDVLPLPFRISSDLIRALSRRRKRKRERKQQRLNDRLNQETAARQQAIAEKEAQQHRTDQSRRAESRFLCQMKYDRLASAIGDRFSVERLAEYFQQYLSDKNSPEEVESRSKQLGAMLDELAGTQATRGKQNLSAIREDFESRRADVEAANFDEETTAALMASLSREEERAIREFTQS